LRRTSTATAVAPSTPVRPRHPGYEVSQRSRKRIEQCFGWVKLIGPIRQVMVRGLDKVDQLLTLTMAAYNLTRLRTLAQLRPQFAQ
jgi:hypothetical protein